MIKTWHIIISGFRQTEDRPNGMTRMWLSLGKHRSPETTIALREWNSDWDVVAETVWWSNPVPEKLVVNVYAYSWGAGWGFTRLAHALSLRGIKVNIAVLSDPVYRHWYALGQWRALVPWSTIIVPSNVSEVFWYRQYRAIPRGHNLVAENKLVTTIHPAVELNHSHVYMDDAWDFQKKAMEIAEQTHRGTNA